MDEKLKNNEMKSNEVINAVQLYCAHFINVYADGTKVMVLRGDDVHKTCTYSVYNAETGSHDGEFRLPPQTTRVTDISIKPGDDYTVRMALYRGDYDLNIYEFMPGEGKYPSWTQLYKNK